MDKETRDLIERNSNLTWQDVRGIVISMIAIITIIFGITFTIIISYGL